MSTKRSDFSSDCYRDIPHTGNDFKSGNTSSDDARRATSAETADHKVLARRVASMAKHPIGITLDVTGSNKELARIFRDKYPSLFGQIMYPGKTIQEIERIEKGLTKMDIIPYSTSYDMMLAYITDALHNTYVMQHTDCVRGEAILKTMEGMVNEGGGGGNERESYELDAYRILHFCDFEDESEPFYFLLCDEVPYATLEARVIKQYLDPDYSGPDIATRDIYEMLFAKLKGRVYIIVNPFCGRNKQGKEEYPVESARMLKYWRSLVPKEYKNHVIKLLWEKSFIDLILGIFARGIGARDKVGYAADMVSKGQDEERVEQVNKMLSFLDNMDVCLSEVPATEGEVFDTGTGRV